MQYKNLDVIVPQSERASINEKILYLIDTGEAEQNGITKEVIYNTYTGIGGLHNLRYSDFDSYNSFSAAKQEKENGEFFTPHEAAECLVNMLNPSKNDIVMDLTSGISVFANFVPVEQNFYGNDFNRNNIKISEYLYPAANFDCKDIRDYSPSVKADIIFGNPPFNINMGEYTSQLYYFIKAYDVLKQGGFIAVIVPSSFMSDDFSYKGVISEIEKRFSFVFQAQLPNNLFKRVGVNNYSTKIMIFQKRSDLITFIPYNTKIINAPTDRRELPSFGQNVFNSIISPVKKNAAAIKNELFLERIRDVPEDNDFEYKIRKMLFDIKRHKKTEKNYAACIEYINKFKNQHQPPDMQYEEWAAKKITPAKVYAYLKRVLRKQTAKPEHSEIRLVKNNGSIYYKGYDRKTRAEAKEKSGKYAISYLISHENYPFEDKRFEKYIQRKRRNFESDEKPMDEIEIDTDIKKYLDTLVIHDSETNENILLNEQQKRDINKSLQKPYSMLQWSMGSGKTLAGIAQALYRMNFQNIQKFGARPLCAFVVSTSLSINNTWKTCLDNYGLRGTIIKKIADIENIKQGEFVLITFNMLIKYKKQIKKFIKRESQKIMLILDESDNISNPDSARTKAVLDCFRRVKYKLLTSGTMTRNSIIEGYTQFELMYNNSVNMINECEYIIRRDKKTKDDYTVENEYFGKPYPPYKKGVKLFAQSHLPEKITVFGIVKRTQDIFNADVLEKLISKTVITREYKDITGREAYTPHQITVNMSIAERNLSNQIINEFYKMKGLFTSTGNVRKDRMLEILQQLNLMMKACVLPERFREYTSNGYSVKLKKLIDVISNFENEYVAVGVRHKDVVIHYAGAIRRAFPKRKIFVVTGDTMTIAERRKMVKEFEVSGNGILISTQQSLESSVNIPFVNKIIIPELAWNIATMEQWAFRFIRYNSIGEKNIYFITYKNSIESNLLSLLMTKEKLTMFMKGDNDTTDVYEKFGISEDILSMLLHKVKDESGKTMIQWGEQKIV